MRPDEEIDIFAEAATAAFQERRPQKKRKPKAVIDLPTFGSIDAAVAHIGPQIADTTLPTRRRLQILWAAASQVRNHTAAEIFFDAFVTAAKEAKLINGQGWTAPDVRGEGRRFGTQDMAHIVRWAMRGMNPFGEGPLDDF